MDNQTNQSEFPLLSVIIRAYNIEKELLDRCVSSAVHQIYNNIEIILINNASKNDTGIYCDEWLQKDSRIRVIHSKKKLGLLNSMKYATGDYIHFLDHDDWIDPEMYSKMMSAMISTNSDIARCEFCFAYPDGEIKHRNITHHTDSFEIIGREEAVLLLLEDKKWEAFIWQNIFKNRLWDHYVTPREKYFGDLASTHTLFHQATQIVYLHDIFYYYYQRHGNVYNPQNIQRRKYLLYRHGNAVYERYLFVKQHPEYNSILQYLKNDTIKRNILSLRDMIDYLQVFKDNDYEEQVERLKQFSLSLRDGKFFFYFYLDLLILKIFPNRYKPFYKLFYRSFDRFIKALRNTLFYQFIKRLYYGVK